jgi:hypothetical protein
MIIARIGVDANAAPEPKPPLLIPAKTIAGIARRKNVRVKSN